MRNRMLNPELFKDEALAALPLGATLLFEGLWCMAEDSGCLEDRPRVIRSEVFGVRDDVTLAEVETWLTALVALGKVERYTVDGRSYLCIVKFLRHQRFKYLPKVSIPIPLWLAEQLRGNVPDDSEASLEVAAPPPEHSGYFRNVPEHSPSRTRGSEAKRSGREAEAQEKRSEAEGGSAGPSPATPPLAACVERFPVAAGRAVAPDEERRIADWLTGRIPKCPPPRDIDAFSWGIARGSSEADSNVIAFAATVAIDAPERAPPGGWNRWNVQERRNGVSNGQDVQSGNGRHPAPAGRKVRPDGDVAAAWAKYATPVPVPDVPG